MCPFRFYRIVHEKCDLASKVLKKAQARVDKKGSAYCPVTNNCEHFANECKTGKNECHQQWTPIEILGKSAISSVGSLTKVAKNSQFMSSYIKKILSVCAKLKKLNIEKLTKEYGGKFNPKFGFYSLVPGSRAERYFKYFYKF